MGGAARGSIESKTLVKESVAGLHGCGAHMGTEYPKS
ncbi:hypothetical protein F442_21139 [Phytophthora nicotianae P10297]|uniref:Uncharacterized protein n=1 Tax=Phytophthora nicotianae P10297 TaxID=1317064 RepID=W2Y550_PHYNI|nr:hypothetical protein F442_21139 [Phytophthora nicotianae P10297]